MAGPLKAPGPQKEASRSFTHISVLLRGPTSPCAWQGPSQSSHPPAPWAAADCGPEHGVKGGGWIAEADSLILPSPRSLGCSQKVTPHPPQRPGQGLVERHIASEVTVCGQVRGQRFADRSLEGIDLVGEVTELCPCQGLWAWAGGQRTGLSRAYSRAGYLGSGAVGYRTPLTAPGCQTGRGLLFIGNFSYHLWLMVQCT